MNGRAIRVGLAVATIAGAAYLVGLRAAGASQEPRHAALLTGREWRALDFAGKQAYLSGFIAGAAAEQVRAEAAARGQANDSTATSSAAIGQLVAAKALWFSYTPAVYAAQLDDFYWHVDVEGTPIVDVLQSLNRRMKVP